MTIGIAALAPKLPAIAKFMATQLKGRAQQAVGIDAKGKALHKAVESFLSAFEIEYKRRETMATLMDAPTKESLRAFVHEPSTLALLAEAFDDAGSVDGRRFSHLWAEIVLPGGDHLVSLPGTFDWNVVSAGYLKSISEIKTQTAELRAQSIASDISRLKEAAERIRGIPPRFSLERYREALLEEYGTLKLSVIHSEYNPSSTDRPVELQKIYVKQRVKEAFPPRDLSRDYRRKLESEARLIGAVAEIERESIAREYERAPARQLWEALEENAYHRTVILGDPGLGKSTLLQHLALNWAEGTSRSIPFLVELRKYTRDHSHPRSFLQFLESGTWSCCHLEQGELDRLLRGGNSTVLFDGLDEVFDLSLRGNIVSEITSFARGYPEARIIVTTRVLGYAVGSPNPELFRSAGFRQLTLQDFDNEEILEFAEKWYMASISDALEREELTTRLTNDIASSSSMRELAGNPLLLTMMALLNRRKHLPRERLKLYESCAELLVEGWDAARHLERSAYLTHDDKIEILQSIAYEMQNEREGLAGNMISEKRVREILIKALRDRNIENHRMAADKIVNALAERDFMLCAIGDEQFSFVHRTFLEYFCAKELLSHLENGLGTSELHQLFRSRWQDDAWHEILRLLCALVGPDLARELILELLAAAEKRDNWKATFLAAESLAEVRQAGKIENERSKALHALRRLLGFRSNVENLEIEVRSGAVQRIAKLWPKDEAAKSALMDAISNDYWKVRFMAAEEIARQWRSEATWEWLSQKASGANWLARMAATHALATEWRDTRTRNFLLKLLDVADLQGSLHTIVEELSIHWPSETTREWLTQIAAEHKSPEARSSAIQELVRRWPDEQTKNWLLHRIELPHYDDLPAISNELIHQWPDTADQMMRLASQDTHPAIRDAALLALVWYRRTPELRQMILKRLRETSRPQSKSRFVSMFAIGWPDETTKQELIEIAKTDSHSTVRESALAALCQMWADDQARATIQFASISDDDPRVRRRALRLLIRFWPSEDTKKLVLSRTTEDKDQDVRSAAFDEIVDRWPDDPEAAQVQLKNRLRASDGERLAEQ